MYYIDANVFIYVALYEGRKHEHARALLEAVENGSEGAATAALTLDEVVWVLSQEASRSVALEQGQRLLDIPNLRFVDVEGATLVGMLQQMRRNEHLRPRDAIHLATMESAGIYTIVSDDSDFDRVDDVDRRGLEEPIVQGDGEGTEGAA
jgi:predicted nucleic acid-binding protein